MKEIIAENVKFVYDETFNYNELNTTNELVFGITFDPLDYVAKDKLKLKQICRVSISDNIFKNKLLVEFLFWYTEVDLFEIDKKVENDYYTDNDFKHSIKTSFIKDLECFHCKTVYKGGLEVMRGDTIYVGNSSMSKIKLNELRAMDKMKKCSKCNGAFNIPIVYIF